MLCEMCNFLSCKLYFLHNMSTELTTRTTAKLIGLAACGAAALGLSLDAALLTRTEDLLAALTAAGLVCSFCSYSRDFPSGFLSHGSLPLRSCPSGLGFRIIAAPRGLSPQCAYRVGRTIKAVSFNDLRPLIFLTQKFYNTQIAHGFIFTADDIGLLQFTGGKAGAALVAVKHLTGVTMAKRIAVNRRPPCRRCKICALTTCFFTGNTQEVAIVFPITAVPGFFVVDICKGMRYFMQHSAAYQLRLFLAKTRHEMTG